MRPTGDPPPGRGAAWWAAALALVLSGAAPSAPPAGLAALAGTYRLTGAAHVEAAPFPARDEELHADAVVSAAPGAGALRLDLAVDTFRCALRATVDAGGALALAPGQRCPVAISGWGEGHAEATLSAGSGALRGGTLELRLVFSLSGRVRLRAGDPLDALGAALSLPGTGGRWTDVSGEVRGRAAGRLDASRAGEAPPPPERAP